MSTDPRCDIIRQRSAPLQPIRTGVHSRITTIQGIRAVLFDIYGTLLISASGDVEASDQHDRARAFEEVMATAGITGIDGMAGVSCLDAAIDRSHQRSHRQGIEHPEVDIRETWREVLAQFEHAGRLSKVPRAGELEQLSVDYEMRVNPVWPMPHAESCVRQLHSLEMRLGVVSNAQFLTPLLFTALLGQSLGELGFERELVQYSFEHGCAKPGRELFDRAGAALQSRGIAPPQVLYVGNDMLKDILPAKRAGFRTALFAGDARSFRLREDDPRVGGLNPDVIVTDLQELIVCVRRE